ncbi:MAG: rod shape-determining protein MreD [Peptoniphilaceae bacterium]|nr:rod shape-determining protein MreD [Peptoniphilaceae bacterium]MDD7383321.1 rod shape-determining protein MreD [Peptoniphilaceae bacterium]MDY3738308.1 rod shape-determining protein MreD [Peptoniphilaceae bacterium]
MNKTKAIFILIISLIIQNTIFSKIDILGANINIILPLIVALSQILGRNFGAYSGLFSGLLEDIIFTELFGVKAMGLFLTGYFSGSNRYKNIKGGIIISFLATIINFFLVNGIYFLLSIKSDILSYVYGPLFVEALLNTAVYVVFYKLIKKIMYLPTYRF